MSRTRPARALAVALFALASANGQSVTNLPPFSATPQQLREAFKDLHVKEEAAVVLLLEEGRFSFDAHGALTFRYRAIFKALTKDGAESWATIVRGWAPWHELRPEIRARVLTPDGDVRELDPKTIADAPAEEGVDVLSDERTVKAPLPAMGQGSIVEEELITRESAPLSPAGSTHYFDFGGSAPVERTRVSASAPPGVPLRYVVKLLPGLSTSTGKSADGGTEYAFEQGPLEPDKDPPPLLPPEQPRRRYLVLTTGREWREVASGYAAVVEKQIAGWDARPYLPKLGRKLDREEKIRAILGKVNAEIRYTGVEFGEASIVPRSPAEVLERKYGDCKDKSVLVAALLRAAGIDAQVALLRSSAGSDIEPDMPGLNVFNHAIVYVPGTPGLWLDPTDPDLRLGVMAPANQGRLALIASDKTTALVRTPESTSAENRLVATREFYLSELGAAKVVETMEAWGTVDRDYRERWGQVEPKKVQEDLKDYGDWTYAAPAVSAASHSDPDDLTKPFELRLEFQDAKRGSTAQAEAAVAIRLAQAVVRLPEFFRTEPKDTGKEKEKGPQAKRSEDFVVPEAFVSEWRYRIVPPPGFRTRQLPEPSDEKFGPASLSMKFQTEPDGVVTGTVKFDLPKRRFGAAEGLALRDALLALEKRDLPMVHFDQVGETLLASGKVKEALVAFRDLEKQHPNEALHCYQVARALLVAGAGEAARAEARRGTELDPRSAKAYANLAVVLRHDLVGRNLRKGYDRAGTVAAYRKALELDPADSEIRANLAIVLEHDEAGRRYAAGAQILEAIAEYRKVEEKLAGLGIPNNLAVALFRAGQMKELREYLRKQPDSEANRGLKLGAVAVLEGPAVAIEAAGQEIPGVEQQQKALLAAGRNLLAVRRYEAAGDLLAAGAAQAPNPAALRNYAEVVRRTRRAEDLFLREDKPEDAVKRFYLAMRDWSDGKDPHRKTLFSRHAVAFLEPEEPRDAERALGLGRANLKQAGLDLDTAIDLSVSMMQFSVDGNDELGYKLRTTLPGTGNKVFYVVREEGRYLLLAAFGSWDGVARLVLALEKAGQLEAARKWLDWVRDDLEPGPVQDPLSRPMFPHVWSKGQKGGNAEIRSAAAVLLSGSGGPQPVPLLQEAVQNARQAEEKHAFAFALAGAWVDAKDYAKAVEVATNLLTEVPDSEMAFGMAVESTWHTGDLARTERLIGENSDRFKTSAAALRAAAHAMSCLGANDRARAITTKLAESGEAEAQDYNGLAWSDLLAGSVTKATDAAIEKAMLLSNGTEHHILHTLAAIQAEEGKPNEARATLLQRMEFAGSEEPNDDDWYVFGRIAEQYGLPDAAKAMYARVAPPKNEAIIRLTSYALTQRRLGALKQAPGK